MAGYYNLTAQDCDGMYVFFTQKPTDPLPVASGVTLQQVVSSGATIGVDHARLYDLSVSGSSSYVANTANTTDKIPAGCYVRAISLVKLGCKRSEDVGLNFTIFPDNMVTAVPANGTVTLVDER